MPFISEEPQYWEDIHLETSKDLELEFNSFNMWRPTVGPLSIPCIYSKGPTEDIQYIFLFMKHSIWGAHCVYFYQHVGYIPDSGTS